MRVIGVVNAIQLRTANFRKAIISSISGEEVHKESLGALLMSAKNLIR